jgi:FMN phosphatase YigB (HAD superfamily)
VISEELGFSKPHPQIFLHALKLTNTEIANTLMVGDSLSSDGEGARRLGMPFCWYNPEQAQNNRNWQPDFMISDLSSLPDINQRILDGKN